MSFNLAIVLTESARSNPHKPAVIAEARKLSYRDLDNESDRVAASLVEAGIRPGDAVGLQLPNIAEFVVSFYGILKVGAVAVPMNILNKAPEVEYFLSDSRAQAMITGRASGEEGVRGAMLAGVKRVFYGGGFTGPTGAADIHSFDELLTARPDAPTPFAQRDPGDPAVLLYTSGTTGHPKGVELTHFQLYMNAKAHVDGFEMTSATTVIAVMPLFHALGLSGILNATLSTGGSVVLIQRFDPEKVLEAIATHKATLLHGVPTMYHAILNHPKAKEFNTSSLDVCGSAGAPIAPELLDAFQREFDVDIIEMYGLTESGPVTTANPRGKGKPYSVGKPIWGVEMQIWDESHNRLPAGKDCVGEIVIRGHNTMRGYLNNEPATKEAFAGGWLHTGDLGYVDEDGFFFIVDRKKEMIIRGGYNVYPREVEDVMYAHPDVDEVAVIGTPDERLGEEVKAFVTLKGGAKATPADLIAYTKERVAAYKYPRYVSILDELPKGPTGKILKKELANL